VYDELYTLLRSLDREDPKKTASVLDDVELKTEEEERVHRLASTRVEGDIGVNSPSQGRLEGAPDLFEQGVVWRGRR